ncbi:MAG: EMC3/TMCO1 family protein [Nitrososphaeria archaeon]|nr:EMC3/TMCO1 family protein [Nitrososphaeria archaeon]
MMFEIAWNQIPYSTILIIMTSIGLNLVSQIAVRFLVNIEEARRVAREAKAFRKELLDAIKSGDKAKEEKLRKKEKSIQQMELKVSNQRLKATFIFIIPFWLVYIFISSLIGLNTTVAVSPISLPFIGYNLQLFWWYLITSFAFATIITKLVGTSID